MDNSEMNWTDVRIQYTGQIAQGLLERASSWASRLTDDFLYKKIATLSVKITDALIEEL